MSKARNLEYRRAPLEFNPGAPLSGRAAVFNQVAELRGFREVIRPGAFTSTLASERDVLALVDHDTGQLLGRRSSGTLELTEASDGLRFRIALPDTQLGRDVRELAQRGDLGGMSFGFLAQEERWQGRTRELLRVELGEISVIRAFPAYPGTSVEPRAATPALNLRVRFLETV